MNILVTGGAGFIGSTLVDAYLRLGHRVWVLDNLSTGKKSQLNSQSSFQKLDVRNRSALRNFFRGKKIDVVNHHAAQMDVRASVADPRFDADVNIFGILNLLELCVQHKVKKFLFSASGGTAYGDCLRAAREGDPEVPLSPYGITKLAGEKYIQSFSALHGLRYTIFRYSNVYGPRQDPHGEAGVVAIFSNLLLEQKQALIFGSGRQTRDFVFVEDVASANLLALTRGHNQILNIGTGQETSVNQLYSTMATLASFNKKPLHKPARAGELNRSFLNISKAKRLLGWVPRFDLKSGLKATLDYFASSR